MDQIIQYFADIPTSHRTLLLVGGLTFFLLIENVIPYFTTKYNKWSHSWVNIFFTLTTVVVNFAMAFLLVWASTYVTHHKVGILQILSIPIWMQILGGLMIMDFLAAYIPHYLEHRIKPLWQFHIVHHSDQHVDVTTANRHHPGESVIRFTFTFFAILIVGAPMWLVFLYQSVSLALSQFIHSNVKMINGVDDALGLLFCTPNMHRVHHHYRQPYSDKNFGNIFSIWDRMFGTYLKVDNEKLRYGLDTHMAEAETNNIGTMLMTPFRKYRAPIQYENEEDLK